MPATLPQETIPVVNAIQEEREKANEHTGPKKTGKAEIAKENKKASESGKGGKKKDSAQNRQGEQHITIFVIYYDKDTLQFVLYGT